VGFQITQGWKMIRKKLEEEINVLNRKLTKSKNLAKKANVDFILFQPCLNILSELKKKKKELNKLDMDASKAVELQLLKNNNNGRTQYVKYR
jgi:hypothetical protein